MSGAMCGWCLVGDHLRCRGWFSAGRFRCPCRARPGCGGPDMPPESTSSRERKEDTSRGLRVVPPPGGGGVCGCCGGPTKGGKFLPGHDSKYLNQLLVNPDRGRAAELADQVSPAFRRKFDARVGVDRG